MHRILWCALAVLASAPALAQDATTVEEADGRLYRYKLRTELDIADGLEISAGVVGPELEITFERRSGDFNPLIRLRHDWHREMADSVDEIR